MISSKNNSKVNKALDNLLSREDYLVTQANDLARSFGNLTALQHKILDFCFSFVQKDDNRRKMYQDDLINLIHHLGLNNSGDSYKRVAESLRMLDLKTNIYLLTIEPDGRRGILMTHLFDHVKVIEDGKFEFRFSEDVAPYVFQLRKNFYSFHLSELAAVKSKYTLTLMKLWNAKGKGVWNPRDLPTVTIEGTLEEWESWFLGSDDKGHPKQWPAGRFKQKVLTVAIKELDRLYPNAYYDLQTIKDKRRVVGYRLDIHPIQTNVPM
ncbi:replication initiation protein [Limosilactobacillus fastidiosus]|uniref:replication initiation protein n=1 Tax=Limosilactobacillus fastidiosus TaxID=2759855 RepID=UPI0022B24AA4|nr:replication initiation protein [Limosilactobacillus fastidiosus]